MKTRKPRSDAWHSGLSVAQQERAFELCSRLGLKQAAGVIAQEFGLAPGSSEMDLRRGIQRMRDEFIARARQKGAGYSPSTVEMFESRGGTTAKALGEIGQGPGRGQISRTVNGETRYWNGTAWVR